MASQPIASHSVCSQHLYNLMIANERLFLKTTNISIPRSNPRSQHNKSIETFISDLIRANYLAKQLSRKISCSKSQILRNSLLKFSVGWNTKSKFMTPKNWFRTAMLNAKWAAKLGGICVDIEFIDDVTLDDQDNSNDNNANDYTINDITTNANNNNNTTTTTTHRQQQQHQHQQRQQQQQHQHRADGETSRGQATLDTALSSRDDNVNQKFSHVRPCRGASLQMFYSCILPALVNVMSEIAAGQLNAACCICFDRAVDIETGCGHNICEGCLDRITTTSDETPICPTCRTELPTYTKSDSSSWVLAGSLVGKSVDGTEDTLQAHLSISTEIEEKVDVLLELLESLPVRH